MNEKFTAIADRITEWVGQWWFTVASMLFLALWVVYGMVSIPDWFTAASWNFPLNTFTTVGEWFLGAFILAAANRVERRNADLLKLHTSLLSAIETLLHQEQEEIEDIVDEIHHHE